MAKLIGIYDAVTGESLTGLPKGAGPQGVIELRHGQYEDRDLALAALIKATDIKGLVSYVSGPTDFILIGVEVGGDGIPVRFVQWWARVMQEELVQS